MNVAYDRDRPSPPTTRPRMHTPAPEQDARRSSGAHPPALSPPGAGPVTRDELEIFRRRVLSEVDEKLEGMAGGLDARVRDVVRAELEPYREGLSRLPHMASSLADLVAKAEATEKYRLERTIREQLERDAAQREENRIALARKEAELEHVIATTAAIPVEGSRKYRLALFGVLATAFAGLVGLLGAMLGSRK